MGTEEHDVVDEPEVERSAGIWWLMKPLSAGGPKRLPIPKSIVLGPGDVPTFKHSVLIGRDVDSRKEPTVDRPRTPAVRRRRSDEGIPKRKADQR